jgi:hypothetical protein
LRVADKTSQRPIAVLLQDHYAGFRDSFTHTVDGEPVWTDWDYALATALQLIEDHTDAETGHLVWIEQSDRVTFDATRFVKKSVAATERKTNGKNYKAQPGERWRTRPVVMNGGDMPTMTEWYEEQAKSVNP